MDRYMILDLQFGSTGKGLLAGCLAKQYRPTAVVTAWGPNAGHTFIGADGTKFVHRMLANGIVSPDLEAIFIGPGSVIDIGLLATEMTGARANGLLGPGVDIFVHDRAAVLSLDDVKTEKKLIRIGSTMKGTAAAMVRKMMRAPKAVAEQALKGDLFHIVPDDEYCAKLREHDRIQIEGAQGFSLGIDHGFYPYVTSRNCTAMATLHACGVPYDMPFEPLGVVRTYPIRVANRYEKKGSTMVQVGTSGPGYFDQEEIAWADLGLEPELTTVTRLPRRVFTYSARQVNDAVAHSRIGPTVPMRVFLNFLNYIKDEEYLQTLMNHLSWAGAEVKWVGVGPTEDDVYELTGGPGWMDDVKEIWNGLGNAA